MQSPLFCTPSSSSYPEHLLVCLSQPSYWLWFGAASAFLAFLTGCCRPFLTVGLSSHCNGQHGCTIKSSTLVRDQHHSPSFPDVFVHHSAKSFEHFDSVCHWVHGWLVDFRLEMNWHSLVAQNSSDLMPPVSQSKVTRDPRYLNWVTLVSGSLLMVPSVWGLHSRYSVLIINP